MKISGYTLRTAIRNRETERDGAIAALAQSLRGQEGPTTEELMDKIEVCEKTIAKLQAFQTRYNLEIQIPAGEENISMAEAVKRIGGIERLSAHWRNMMTTASSTTMAAAAIKFDTNLAIQKSKQFATEASTLRGRMSAANSVEIELSDFEESLLQ